MKSKLTLSAKKGFFFLVGEKSLNLFFLIFRYEFENLDGLLNAVEKRGYKKLLQIFFFNNLYRMESDSTG